MHVISLFVILVCMYIVPKGSGNLKKRSFLIRPSAAITVSRTVLVDIFIKIKKEEERSVPIKYKRGFLNFLFKIFKLNLCLFLTNKKKVNRLVCKHIT